MQFMRLCSGIIFTLEMTFFKLMILRQKILVNLKFLLMYYMVTFAKTIIFIFTLTEKLRFFKYFLQKKFYF